MSISTFAGLQACNTCCVWFDNRSGLIAYRRDVLRESTRQEYDLARHEQDPELVREQCCASAAALRASCVSACLLVLMVAPSRGVDVQVSRMIVAGRDAVQQAVDKVMLCDPCSCKYLHDVCLYAC